MNVARIPLIVVAAALVLTGCGQVERPYSPRQAAEAAAPEQEPEQSGADDYKPAEPDAGSGDEPDTALKPGSGTQTIKVGDDLKLRIEWPDDPDPRLKVAAEYYVGTRKAVVEGKDTYDHNLELDAAVRASDWVRGVTEDNKTFRGVGRIYDLKVVASVGRGSEIWWCVDETGMRLIDATTGKAIRPQPVWTREQYGEGVAARRGDDGVWQIRMFTPGAEGCTR
ncbi:hypothetical protein HII36_26570 [Nonomuraea sp. NN258]|uniref:hypothetical protein n=1 Tax=Nonomuraea antri TaxID=2730852 RepID=UPI001569CC90|nr:hypothetical protein [Nonomuraea antri]NRQ35365.1 hypothetical protein [Nonomuraea antri]